LSARLTPSQTVGPYLDIGLPWEQGAVADPGGVRIAGRVLDGAGEPVTDALVETWDAASRSFARCPTAGDGTWFVVTPRPPAGHLAVSVFARGLLHRVVTRIYLDLDPADPVLARVPAGRRDTLVAQRSDDGYRFDIRLQGPGETVFFDV
jgi:protocatechuate 3,4-dioxygenase, alpha subunit